MNCPYEWVSGYAYVIFGDVSSDNTIKLWHLYSQELINTLSGHLSTVHSVAFNVDGNKIISGSADHTIRIWQSEQ
ncbi:hypothetical protein PN497_08275 [Sphaerospermopsis kisseleviana CS-549]|uniref:Uncharacterized protein n=1 Tax=Sphaerospermopsis kisseleviana CS-549 TaxID=3021783 RepID=A0ABT4ZQP3_9CYAN|nr:hypothetical protein [Sphaerospermopsis kisseleviana]MDB9441354.1 hypothetical protein [Sphaerospermopsis kisseleviana CS-549]BAZ78922.1 WD40 domain-containing protein [Sphaerospermopsis kisseleviana NIES-73]